MRAIFISYRREDSEGHAGRLFKDLCDRFGKESVFMDVAGIEPGRDFRRVIEEQVASCGVLLALIGKDWIGVIDANGKRRLDDPYDFVRLETAHALKRDIPVIPVLVQSATMPREEQLPDDLKDLAFRNSVELTHARWNSDVQLLIDALLPYVDAVPAAPTPPPETAPTRAAVNDRRTGWMVAPLAALATGGIGYLVWDRLAEPPSASVNGAPATSPAPAASGTPAPAISASPMAPTPSASAASAAPVAAGPTAGPALAPAHAPGPAPAPAPPTRRHIDKPTVATARAPKPAAAPAPTVAAPAVRAPAPAPAAPIPAPLPAPSPAPAPVVAAPSPAPPAPLPSGPVIVPARQDPGLELLGSPGAVSMVTRTIAIRPDTSYVNVTGGEIIRFDVGSRSFVWNFSGTRSSFDLSRVAPPSVLDRPVTAYVAPNPMYPRRH